MPKEVLHLLYGNEEASPFHNGEAIHINTHGVEHVVIQLERKRYTRRPTVDVLTAGEKPMLTYAPRKKTDQCRHCHKPMTPQGKWKHELYCKKQKRGN